MKIVRKLLRLLPLLYFLLVFMVLIFGDGIYPNADSGTDISQNVADIISALNPDSGVLDLFFDSFAFGDIFFPIRNWFANNLGFNYYFGFAFDVLVYELFLSLAFLIFDVFNFMITIASKWLRKGESLNE